MPRKQARQTAQFGASCRTLISPRLRVDRITDSRSGGLSGLGPANGLVQREDIGGHTANHAHQNDLFTLMLRRGVLSAVS